MSFQKVKDLVLAYERTENNKGYRTSVPTE